MHKSGTSLNLARFFVCVLYDFGTSPAPFVRPKRILDKNRIGLDEIEVYLSGFENHLCNSRVPSEGLRVILYYR